MEAALISNNLVKVSESLTIKGCVYFNKYISIRRGDVVAISFSQRQFEHLVGKEFAHVVEKGTSYMHAFSANKKIAMNNGVISLIDKEKELKLTTEEHRLIQDKTVDIMEIFQKFVVLTPVAPSDDVMQQQQQQQPGIVNAVAGVAPNGSQVVAALHLGPQYTYCLNKLVQAQNTPTPSFRRRMANRMCDEEIHVLVLAALVRNELDDDERKKNCRGCIIDHGSQVQHMNPGHLDDDVDVVEQWLARPAHRKFFRTNVEVLAKRLGAPIGDCSDDVSCAQVVKAIQGDYHSFCIPCRIMVPLFTELLEDMGL